MGHVYTTVLSFNFSVSHKRQIKILSTSVKPKDERTKFIVQNTCKLYFIHFSHWKNSYTEHWTNTDDESGL